MVPGYSNHHGRKYPYYTCLKLQKRGAQACPGQTVSASRLERVVVDRMYELAQDPGRPELRETVQLSRRDWDSLESSEQRRILAMLFERIGYDHRRQQVSLQLLDSTSESEIVEARIQLSEGTNSEVDVEPRVLDVVASLDGRTRLGDVIPTVGDRLGLPRNELSRLERDALQTTRELLELGALGID